MTTTGICGRKLLVAAILCGFAVRAAIPQQTTTGTQTTAPQGPLNSAHDPFGDKAQDDKDRVEMPKGMQERLQLARQSERQKRLVDDTDKLLALATQLHKDVAKTDKNILSVDVIKRAEEIERLAHAVKERMKG